MGAKDVIFILIILVLLFIVGYQFKRNRSKRRNDIIKLQIKKDLLPPPGKDTEWVNGGACYMSDGSIGKVNGLYCEQTTVL